MDFNEVGLTYILLLLPILFALTVFSQGLRKLKDNNPDGWIAIGFSIVTVMLIIAAYFLFIR
jgi:hypothetical protein